MATNANPLYPRGTPFTEVIISEHEHFKKAQAMLEARIAIIEERLLIINSGVVLSRDHPALTKAYKKFLKEESKMVTFEALKNSK